MGWLTWTHAGPEAEHDVGQSPGPGCSARTQGTGELSHAPPDTCVSKHASSLVVVTPQTLRQRALDRACSALICVFHPHFVKLVSKLGPSAGGCDFVRALNVCCYGRKGTDKRPSCLHKALCIPTDPLPRTDVAQPVAREVKHRGRREHSALLCVCSWRQLAEQEDSSEVLLVFEHVSSY